MERRHFLKLAAGFAAGAAVLTGGVQAAPLSPQPLEDERRSPSNQDIHRAVTSQAEVDRLKPEEIRWGHHGHGHHGHGHHWGWRHRRWHWHRRHWGWHRRHWHRHRWW